MPNSYKNQTLNNIKERFALEELSSGQKVGCLQLFDITHRKKDESLMTTEAAEIMEKQKDKKAEYEAIASSDSFVNLDDIDNRIITEVLGLGSSQQYVPSGNQAQSKVQRLRNQMAEMQVSTVEQLSGGSIKRSKGSKKI
ncbi:UvrABC system C [Gossypium arboreum]|uniref:UvrABC system C n=1 Tax=Gossypium arboreum TaxID=29729 RepID=A0A0B0MP46_GOSAR|nr:UvrABC system C [Gossypium arboreum]